MASPDFTINPFLPRDAMHMHGLCCHAVSVRPSVRHVVDDVKTNKHMFDFFHRRVAIPFYFFDIKGGADIPTGTPPNGGVECRGYDKMTIFSQICRSISETVIGRSAHAARQFVSIKFSFQPDNM